ncbi:MAG TPA: hypothetical protein VFW19_04605 [Allosphingosinicella sp.]|nr:hypothetical protein [Allosphingosinicella sp.]
MGPPEAEVWVQFNPASLRLTLTNQFGEDPPDQHAKATTAKLDVELVFDSTDDGSDVRRKTQPLHDFTMATGTAAQQGNGTAQGSGSGAAGGNGGGAGQNQANYSLPKVRFCWGSMSYVGVFESLTETLDYWSSDGVPLRATLQVSLKGQAGTPPTFANPAGRYNDNALPPAVFATPVSVSSSGAGVTDAASAGGDPFAGRFLAAMNGLENMRAPMGADIGASASISLSAAAGFQVSGGISAGFSASASAGFSLGASAGASAAAGLSASVGVGMSGGAGFGLSAGAGFGASAGIGFSASASAGIGASAGVGFGASAGVAIGASAGVGFGASASASAGIGFSASASVSSTTIASTTTVAGTSTTISISSGRASAGMAASDGAFAGLGPSKTTMPSGGFNPDRLLPPPRPAVGIGARFDETGMLVSGNGQVAASWSDSVTIL